MNVRGALLLLAVAAVSPEIPYFQYERPLSAPAARAGQTCVVLDGGLFARAAPQLADLRLYRGQTETPYVVRYATPVEEQQGTIQPLNLGSRRGQTVFDAAMPEGRYSDIDLNPTGKDFIATVTVTGSETQGSGGETRLGSYTIFDLTRQKLGRSTILHLPESDFRYLHFRIAGPLTPQSITGLSIDRLPQSKSQYVTVAESSQVTQKGHETTIQFRVPADVPVDRIEFVPAAEPANFSRAVIVKAAPVHAVPLSTDSAPPEPLVTSGNLLRVHGTHDGHRIDEERLAVDSPWANFGTASQWTIAIDNGDDPPLPIQAVSLQMIQRQLCFDAAAGAAYTLFYGDPALQAPRYDYATLFTAEADAAQATLGPEEKNPQHQSRPDQRPFTEKHPGLLWTALVLVILVLGVVAVRTAKQTAPAPK
jgi:hypothetical protein